MVRALLLLFLVLFSGCVSRPVYSSDVQTPSGVWELNKVGMIDDDELIEISGIASSRLQSNLLWMVNDGGNPAVLYGVSTTGETICRIQLPELENRDWEDLASFWWKDEAWLLIGEIGDNKARYEKSYLHLIKEPRAGAQGVWPESAPVEKTRTFVYEDGPRDAEGLIVDPDLGKIWILSKRTTPPVLYSLPLENSFGLSGTAKRGQRLEGLREAGLATKVVASDRAKYFQQPTAMDLEVEQGWLAVMTYAHAYFYTWPLPAEPQPKIVYPLPRLKQGEALCFSNDGLSVYFTSEKKPTPLYKLSLSYPNPVILNPNEGN